MDGITIPTLQELFQMAPIATIVLLIAGLGYWAGFRARQETIDVLREWLKDEQSRKRHEG